MSESHVRTLLSGLTDVARVTRGEPAAMEQLPCLIVREVESESLFADDAEYLRRETFEIVVAAKTGDGAETLATRVEAAMADDGFSLLTRANDDKDGARRVRLRFVH